MYARVFASCGVSGGRGPNSICLRTWSIARSPLKAAGIGAAFDCPGLVETLARGRGGGSFFGHAEKGSGVSNAATSKAARLVLGFLIGSLRLCACACSIHDRIESFGTKRERLLDRRVERFRRRDRFELHQGCDLLAQWQRAKLLLQIRHRV